MTSWTRSSSASRRRNLRASSVLPSSASPGAAFRCRYRELHRGPHLLGLLHGTDYGHSSRFISTSAFRPAESVHPDWHLLDCRHGRALFFTPNPDMVGVEDLFVWDPVTDEQRWLPHPSFSRGHYSNYTAEVLCAVQGCAHCGCRGGPFRVAFVYNEVVTITSARLYSSEAGTWGEPVSVHHPFALVQMAPSVLVGDVLYFHAFKNIIEYQLRTPRLSSSKLSTMSNGRLMVAENGRLGFASVDHTRLALWSRQITTKGEERWVQCRVINLKKLLPDGALSVSQSGHYSNWCRNAHVAGVAEGSDIIFVGTDFRVYMVQLKSRRVRNVLNQSKTVFPYMSFYIPAMEAASADEEDQQGAF